MVIKIVSNNGTTNITMDSDSMNVLFNALIIAKEAVNSDLNKYADHPKIIEHARKTNEEFKYFLFKLEERRI